MLKQTWETGTKLAEAGLEVATAIQVVAKVGTVYAEDYLVVTERSLRATQKIRVETAVLEAMVEAQKGDNKLSKLATSVASDRDNADFTALDQMRLDLVKRQEESQESEVV